MKQPLGAIFRCLECGRIFKPRGAELIILFGEELLACPTNYCEAPPEQWVPIEEAEVQLTFYPLINRTWSLDEQIRLTEEARRHMGPITPN